MWTEPGNQPKKTGDGPLSGWRPTTPRPESGTTPRPVAGYAKHPRQTGDNRGYSHFLPKKINFFEQIFFLLS